MSIKLNGQWKVRVSDKSAAFDQRIVISGTTNGKDGVYPYKGFGTKTLEGGFGIQIQYEKGDAWYNSLMRIGNVSQSDSNVCMEIQSDDNVGSGDLDFNDLVLDAEKEILENEYCLWGHIRKYSGCYFNPCLFPRIVIDDLLHASKKLPKDFIGKIDPFLPERPPVDFPDPPPPPPWDYKATRVEVPENLAKELIYSKGTENKRGMFRTTGIKTLKDPAIEAYDISEAVNIEAGEIVGQTILNKFRRRCLIEPFPGAIIRILDYDPGPGESTGQLFSGTGNKDILGHVITDDYGFYLFCFTWPHPHINLKKPDVMLQFMKINEEGTPSVVMESHISWNIDKLQRKDFCIPANLAEDSPTDDIIIPSRIFQYTGNLPVSRITQTGSEKGYATSETGDLVSVIKAPFGGVLYLKGSFHDFPSVKSYRITYHTTDNPDGNISETLLLTPLNYYNTDFDLVTVGPGPLVFSDIPVDAYPVMNENYQYSHPFGRQYFAYINTNTLKTGKMKTGLLHIQIKGLDAAGSEVAGAVDQFTVRIDNVPPVPEIMPITPATGPALGCGLIEITDPNGTFPLTFRVSDADGHLHKYYFRMFKCHNNRIGNDHYTDTYSTLKPLRWYGTIDDASSTWDGWKTVTMPNEGELFTPSEVAAGVHFVAVSVELWAISRSTDGRHHHLHWPRCVEVVGIKLNSAS